MPTKYCRVNDRRYGQYIRTKSTYQQHFTCQRCNQWSEREQWPGPSPKYCLTCLPIASAERNAARVRAHRARKRAKEQQQPPTTTD